MTAFRGLGGIVVLEDFNQDEEQNGIIVLKRMEKPSCLPTTHNSDFTSLDTDWPPSERTVLRRSSVIGVNSSLVVNGNSGKNGTVFKDDSSGYSSGDSSGYNTPPISDCCPAPGFKKPSKSSFGSGLWKAVKAIAFLFTTLIKVLVYGLCIFALLCALILLLDHGQRAESR